MQGVFAHGSSAHTTVVDMWLNDTKGLALEGDTNRDVRDPTSGACIDDPMNLTRQGTQDGMAPQIEYSDLRLLFSLRFIMKKRRRSGAGVGCQRDGEGVPVPGRNEAGGS